MAELSKTGVLGMDTAALAIVLATMSNTLVKGGIALLAGSATLRKSLVPVIVMILVVGMGSALLL
jgi:uncharacterized membrane protein (DUF4010 family)